MNPQNYTINIRPGWGISQVVKVSQGDVGRPLAFTIMDGQDAITLSSTATVTITGTKPSGLGFTQDCTLSGNTASIDTVATMTQEAGSVPAELIVTDGSTVIGTANFVMYVEPAAHPEGTTDGDAETARDLMTRAQAAVAQAEAEADRAEDAAESVSQAGISTVGATAGQVPTANGAGGWSWQDQQGGGGTSDDIENKSSVSGATVTGALNSLSDQIANEQTTRAGADESLRQAIDDLVSPSGASVVVDSSLSISGAAADAKAVGDELAGINERLDSLAGVPSDVRQTIVKLLKLVPYMPDYVTDPTGETEYDLSADFTKLENWASTQATGIALSDSTLTFTEAGTRQLRAIVTPPDADGVVSWASSDNTVATVSSIGLVTPVGNGTCTIVASIGGLSANCAVSVSGIALVYGITKSIDHCTSSNSASTAAEGSSYTTTLTANEDYNLADADITVRMGDVDITSTAVSTGGVITIASVTGAIEITATVHEWVTFINTDPTTWYIPPAASRQDTTITFAPTAINWDTVVKFKSLPYTYANLKNKRVRTMLDVVIEGYTEGKGVNISPATFNTASSTVRQRYISDETYTSHGSGWLTSSGHSWFDSGDDTLADILDTGSAANDANYVGASVYCNANSGCTAVVTGIKCQYLN